MDRFFDRRESGASTRLVALRVDPGREDADLYTLTWQGDETDHEPLRLDDGFLLFFRCPTLADAAAATCRCSAHAPRHARLLAPDVVCDIAEMLALVRTSDRDRDRALLDGLNLLFDLLGATDRRMPEAVRRVLFPLANHVGFDGDFSGLLLRAGVTRAELEDALLWCLGALWSRLRVYEHGAPPPAGQ